MTDGAPIECVWPVAATLGEGPVWDGRTRCLWFADIKRGRLHRFDPATGARETVELGGNPSFVLPAEGGGLVIGNRRDLVLWRDGRSAPLAHVAMRDGDRCNDATVDRAGRVWFGSMDDSETQASGLVRVFERGAVREAGGAAVITNGPAISRDGRWLYHVDTLGGTIWRFDLDAGDDLSVGAPFAVVDAADGKPDGVTIDAEDHVWVGLWGGWAARRYAPDGRVAGAVRLPCANVTKVAFGGPDLRTGYVTTARAGLDAAALAAQPLAGGLFAFEAEAPGVALPLVKL